MNPIDRFTLEGLRRAALRAALALTCAAVAACSSGSAGDGVAIGSPQAAGDPVSPDFPVAYVRRTLPGPDAEPLEFDLRTQRVWNGPADVYLRDRASPSALERNITERITDGAWDVRDLDVSYDGRRLLFAMRPPLLENADESEQPKWSIYEYEVEADRLRRVIGSDIVAAEGHDVAPTYLPDGRIVFSSTRQRRARAIQIDEGGQPYPSGVERRSRNLPAFVLHVMNADGTNIQQLSFNMAHDLDPAVLSDGRILFTRWDNVAGEQGMHLYTINPDGSGLQLLYGRRSHQTGSPPAQGQAAVPVQFIQPRERPDGGVVALLQPYDGTEGGGDPVLIDTLNYVENRQSVRGGGAGPAQSRLVTNDVRTIPGPSPGGRFASVFPLWDGTDRLLTSWSQCRLVEQTRIVPCTSDRLAQPGVQPAPPLYGIWIYDPRQNTQLPIVAPQEGMMFTEVVALQPRRAPDVPAPVLYSPVLSSEDVGILNIKSVYDINGVDRAPGGIATVRNPALTTIASRPARFLRIERAVGLPDEEILEELPQYAFGNAGVGMRKLIGYVPIEPDGSVRVKVPANVPLDITVLDRNGRRLSGFFSGGVATPLGRHRNWLQVRAGEVLTCAGCHAPSTDPAVPTRSHGRWSAETSINPGAVGGQSFPGTLLRVPDPAGNLIVATERPAQGETMAEFRARVQNCLVEPCGITPSVNIQFADVWSLSPAADSGFTWSYSALATPQPTDCDARWEARCRVVIHYPRHVAPLWARTRVVLVDPNDPTSPVAADLTCTACHTPTNPADNQPRVPAGQLDLRNDPSDDMQLRMRSYQELLFTDNAQELIMGALRDIVIPPDPLDPLALPTFVTVQPSMSFAGANASGRFFSQFAPGNASAAAGHYYDAARQLPILEPSELKLIAEWLDLGGQYYNDPFAIPVQ